MSVYNNYKLGISNNFLLLSQDNKKLFEYSSNSNTSYSPVNATSFGFTNTNYGIDFNYNNNQINFKSQGVVFDSDISVSGKFNVTNFPSNVVLLDKNNKINLAYIPDFSNNLTLTCNAIGIGVNNALAKLHLKNGDQIIENGRLGIGTVIPRFNFHLNKNDTMPEVPAFTITKDEIRVIDIYSEKQTVVINENSKLNVYGITTTDSLNVSNNLIADNQKVIINNELFLNTINSASLNKQIVINSNLDLIISNISMKNVLSNINEINECFDVVNKNIIFSSNINFDIDIYNQYITINNKNNKIVITSNNLITSNITVNNLTLNNYDSLTSNPTAESVFDIKGKIKLYNDSPSYFNTCFANNISLFIITNDNKLYSQNLTTKVFSLIKENFNYSIFKAKFNSFGYYYNNDLYINHNSFEYIISGINIKDFALFNYSINAPAPLFVYCINQNNQVVTYNLASSIGVINQDRNDVAKIDTYIDNSYVFSTINGSLFYYNNNIYTQITFNPTIPNTTKILDFSSGNTHTLVLTTTGVWSFGNLNDNLTFKKGYAVEAISATIALPISLLTNTNDFKIVKIKANNNSSIAFDNKGFVYVFGTINKLFNSIIIAKINNYSNIIDFCCNNANLFFISYFNDLFTITTNNQPQIIILPNDFYGTSIKTRGSLIVGGANFETIPPRNSLLVERYVGIGANLPLNSSNYVLEIAGNINLIDGSIYKNGALLSLSGGSSGSGNTDITWSKNNNDIYYTNGFVGIGIASPKSKFHLNGGNAIFENDVYINGNLITYDYKPIVINHPRNVYYNGLFGLNTAKPQATLHLFDGVFKSTSTNMTFNNTTVSSYTSNVISGNNSTAYVNQVLLSQDNSTIISSFINLDSSFNNNNNSNVEIYRYLNNSWKTFKIRDVSSVNSSFGESIAISKDGRSIFIGAYKERDTINTSLIVGGIYKYTFNSANNLVKNLNKEIYFSTTNGYYQIGRTIACSGDGSILISTVDNYNDLLYIKNLTTNETTILNFSDYGSFHSSFYTSTSLYTTSILANNSFSYNNQSLDSSDNGKIIVSNFIYNFSQITINNFTYFNFYIIYNNQIYLLKFPSSFNNQSLTNSLVSSVSVTGDGSKIFITTTNGNHFIYDFDFDKDNYITTVLNVNLNTNIFYYDKEPSFVFTKARDFSNDTHYRGKIAKSGNVLFLANNKNVFIYKLNKIDNSWIQENLLTNVNLLTSINNYSISLDFDGYNCALSYLNKLQDLSSTDTIQVVNNYLNFLQEKTNLDLNNNNLTLNIPAFFNSNTYAPYYYGDGYYLSNISFENIITTINPNGVVYTNDNRLYTTANFRWSNNDNSLNVNGLIDCKTLTINNTNINDIYLPQTNQILTKNGGTGLSNITSNRFLIGNGSNQLIVSSNLIWNNNTSLLTFSNNASFVINSRAPIIRVPFLSNSHIAEVIVTSNGGTGNNNYFENSLLYFSSNKIVNSYGIYWCNLESNLFIDGSINVTSNILINGKSLNSINFDDITGLIPISKGGTGVSSFNDGWLLAGSSSSNLNSYSNLRFDNSTGFLIVDNLTVGSNLILQGSNLSNISISGASILNSIGVASAINGELFFGSNGTEMGTSEALRWDNSTTSLMITNGTITTSNLFTSNILVNGKSLNTINFDDITGLIPISKGGTGVSSFNDGWLLAGSSSSNLNSYSNLRFDNSTGVLIVDNLTVSSNLILQGSNLSNISISGASILNSIGVASAINGELFFGSNGTEMGTSEALRWDNSTTSLMITNGTITTSNLFTSNILVNGKSLNTINFDDITGLIPISKGGTGVSSFNDGWLIMGSFSSNLNSYSNLRFDNSTGVLIVDNITVSSNLIASYFYGDGGGLSNLNSSNLLWNNNSLTINDGTIATSNVIASYFYGDGGGLSNLNSSNLLWNNNSLIINDGTIATSNVIASYFYGDGGGLSNLNSSNLIWNNNSLIINDGTIATSNVIASYFYGDGGGLSNLNSSNINGIIPVSKGGTGASAYSNGWLLMGTGDNYINAYSNLRFDNLTKIFTVDNLEINSNLIVNQNLIKSNLGIENATQGELFFGSNGFFMGTSANLRWSNNENILDLKNNGIIKTSNIEATNIFVNGKNITQIDISSLNGIIPVTSGGTGIGAINSGYLLFGDNSTVLGTNSNLYWDNTNNRIGIGGSLIPQKTLDINGDINFNGFIYNNNKLLSNIYDWKPAINDNNTIYTNKNLYLDYNSNDNYYKFKVNGNVFASGEIYSSSDIRLKTNISNINEPIKKIEQLNGVYYNLISNEKRCIGLIAQEVEKIIPEVVYTNIDNTKAIAYTNMVGLLVESIKELSSRIGVIEEKLNYHNINRI
jgi:hypothetical protein